MTPPHGGWRSGPPPPAPAPSNGRIGSTRKRTREWTIGLFGCVNAWVRGPDVTAKVPASSKYISARHWDLPTTFAPALLGDISQEIGTSRPSRSRVERLFRSDAPVRAEVEQWRVGDDLAVFAIPTARHDVAVQDGIALDGLEPDEH